jgi:hypothetical protein
MPCQQVCYMSSKYIMSMIDKLQGNIHGMFLSLVTVFAQENFEDLHSGC